jgi:hypothetical protein
MSAYQKQSFQEAMDRNASGSLSMAVMAPAHQEATSADLMRKQKTDVWNA